VSYDADGNLLYDGNRVLAYNAENQLVRVAIPGASESRYDYDYLGRRVRKSVVAARNGSGPSCTVTWVNSGWNNIEERRTIDGATAVNNFVWGLDLSQSMEGSGGIGSLLAVVDETGKQMSLIYDAKGDVTQLADNQGALQARYEYDAVGQVLVADGVSADQNSWRHSTKYADGETGLVYYGARYYMPAAGRWTQRDRIGENGGANLYAFVRNETPNLFDSFGDVPAGTPPYFPEPGALDGDGSSARSGAIELEEDVSADPLPEPVPQPVPTTRASGCVADRASPAALGLCGATGDYPARPKSGNRDFMGSSRAEARYGAMNRTPPFNDESHNWPDHAKWIRPYVVPTFSDNEYRM